MHLFVQGNFAIKVLLGNGLEVLSFLYMIGFHFCHGCVQYGLATGSHVFISLNDAVEHDGQP